MKLLYSLQKKKLQLTVRRLSKTIVYNLKNENLLVVRFVSLNLQNSRVGKKPFLELALF